MSSRTPPRFDRSTLDQIRKYLAGYGGAAGRSVEAGDDEADARGVAAAHPPVPPRSAVMAPVVPVVPLVPLVPVVPAVPVATAGFAALVRHAGNTTRTKTTTAPTQLVLPSFGSRLGALAGTTAREIAPARKLRSAPEPRPRGVELPDEVVVVDTETTGIDRRARLVEIGALRVRGGVVVDQFQTLVDPEMRIPSEVIRVHGITDAMVKGAPHADAALAAFLAWVAGASLVAHNAHFDRRIFAQELTRIGRPAPGLPVFCTLRMARKGMPGHPGYGLGVLAKALNIQVTGAHRALADCRTTVGLLGHLLRQHSRQALGQLHGPPRLL